jgi:hypothetical protein
LVLVSETASVGIDIGPNAAENRFSHWWRLSRVMVIGDTPNWSSTALGNARNGFSTAAFQVQTAFYGEADHVEASFAAGAGVRLFDRANGNTFVGSHLRENATGLKIEGTGGGNSNGNRWVGGNIEASFPQSIGVDIGEGDRNRIDGRIEISASGGIHVRINPPGTALAQENKLDLELTGTSAGYVLGDGWGNSQVRGTVINGGPFGASVTINTDALQTVVNAAPTGVAGVRIVDNGYGSILRGDVGGARWYERPSNQNTNAYNHDLLVGTGSVREAFGRNARTMSWTALTDGFQWYPVAAGSTVLAVMRFGNYRVWVSPTNGKLYIKGGDPIADDDGTVVGTQQQ